MKNQIIRVTREFTFETAHVLWNYDGPCRNVHGHSYRLFVTVKGTPGFNPGGPKNGMVIDFTDLKKIVMSEVVGLFDHAVAVGKDFDPERFDAIKKAFGNVVVVDYQPTCENMVADFAGRISSKLPEGVILHSLKLYETAKSYAEWYASDND